MIFISYAREDHERASKIDELIRSEERPVFFDKVDLLPGMDWEYEIEERLRKCSLVLILCSRHSVAKEGFVQREIRAALKRIEQMPDGRVFIVPIRFDNVEVPTKIAKYNWIDVVEPVDYFKIQWFVDAVWKPVISRGQPSVSIDSDSGQAKEPNTALINETIVILLQGSNSSGEPIYSYLKTSLWKFRKLSDHVASKKDFIPSEWGEVVAAGNGEPSPETRAEMARKYNLVDVPKPLRPMDSYSVNEYAAAFVESFRMLAGHVCALPEIIPPTFIPDGIPAWQLGMKAGAEAASQLSSPGS